MADKGLYQQLPEFCRNAFPDDAILVVLPPRSTAGLIAWLLQMAGVIGLLGDIVAVESFPDERRIFHVPQSEKWACSVSGAQVLVLAEPLSIVSWQWILGAWRSGVRVLVTPEAGNCWRMTLAWRALVTQVLVRGGRKLLQKVAFGNNWLARLWWGKVVQSARAVSMAPHVRPDPGKILLVIGSLSAGGAERQIVHLANCLVAQGTPVSLLVQQLSAVGDRFFLGDLDPKIGAIELPTLSELELHCGDTSGKAEPLPVLMDGALFSMTLHPRVVNEMKRYYLMFMSARPEVVHVWLDSTAVTAGFAALLAGVPRIVLGGRNLAPYRFGFFQPYFFPLYRLLVASPGVVMLNNSFAGAADYALWLGMKQQKVQVVYNGINPSVFAPPIEDVVRWRVSAGLVEGSPVVGGVFRFSPEKEPRRWVDVARRLLLRWPENLPAPRFLLVGDGPLWGDTVAYARNHGLAEHVVFVKREPKVALAISSMDVLLLTSRDEGTPNVLIEAQALGCPVVTTNAGGCAETVLDGKTGWVVPAGDSEALADRILSILEDGEWRMAARIEAMRFVRERFSTERLVEAMKRIYGGA